MENVGIPYFRVNWNAYMLCGHLVYFVHIRNILGSFDIIVVIWYFFPVLVHCTYQENSVYHEIESQLPVPRDPVVKVDFSWNKLSVTSIDS
jgi:hypothetical protein